MVDVKSIKNGGRIRMLALRIIGTVLIGFSCFTCLFKNIGMFSDRKDRYVIGWTAYGWLWRAFIIVALWVI